MRSWQLLVAGFIFASVTACGVETVVHRVDEREANRIVELLEDVEIQVTKGMIDTGREIHFSITVPAKDRVVAATTAVEMPTTRA